MSKLDGNNGGATVGALTGDQALALEIIRRDVELAEARQAIISAFDAAVHSFRATGVLPDGCSEELADLVRRKAAVLGYQAAGCSPLLSAKVPLLPGLATRGVLPSGGGR